jgi:hypothetical protein
MSSSLQLLRDFCGLGVAKDFVEQPRPVFGFVDPVLDQTRGGDIVVLVADVVRNAQVLDQLLVVPFAVIVEWIPDQRAMVCRNPGSQGYRRAEEYLHTRRL